MIYPDGSSQLQYFPATRWTGMHTFRIGNMDSSPLQIEGFLDKMIEGDTTQLTVNAFDETGSLIEVTNQVVFQSKNTDVAEINESGFVTAKKAGTTSMTIQYGDTIITRQLIVLELNPELILDQLETYIQSGDVRQPLSNQLNNRLQQAIHHGEKDHRKQAIKSLSDFLKHMSNKAHANQISEQAKETLTANVEALIEKWEGWHDSK